MRGFDHDLTLATVTIIENRLKKPLRESVAFSFARQFKVRQNMRQTFTNWNVGYQKPITDWVQPRNRLEELTKIPHILSRLGRGTPLPITSTQRLSLWRLDVDVKGLCMLPTRNLFSYLSIKLKKYCHQMSHLEAKMHQIRFRLGLRPKPRWGAYNCIKFSRKSRPLRFRGVPTVSPLKNHRSATVQTRHFNAALYVLTSTAPSIEEEEDTKIYASVFSTLFDLSHFSHPVIRSLSLPPSTPEQQYFCQWNIHLFRLHTQWKGNKLQTIIINLRDSWACFECQFILYKICCC